MLHNANETSIVQLSPSQQLLTDIHQVPPRQEFCEQTTITRALQRR